MGGIAGCIDYRSTPRIEVQQLSSGIAHRGKDDKGNFSDGPISMAFRQFHSSATENSKVLQNSIWAIVLDSRIYNFSHETFLKEWTEKETAFLAKICGPFVFAAWNKQTQTLYVVRSREGSRPVFWVNKGDKFAFCSELPPLLKLDYVSRDLAIEHLAEQLSFRYVHAPRTLLHDVQSVPAGFLLKVQNGNPALMQWWQPRWSAVDHPPLSPNEVSWNAVISACRQCAKWGRALASLQLVP